MNTRFNPTVNGLLHLGHAYLILLNEGMAHGSGGRFIVRFDDNQIDWLNKLGALQMAHYAEMVREDLDWLEVRVDGWHSQAVMEEGLVFQRMMKQAKVTKTGDLPHVPHLVGSSSAQYPYDRYLCAEKVAMDALNGVTCVVRGAELYGEYGLYCFYREFYGMDVIPHYYIQRLMAQYGEMADVSKTQGNHKIATCRAQGMSREDVHELLRVSCLKEWRGPWDIHNLKPNPRLIEVEYD